MATSRSWRPSRRTQPEGAVTPMLSAMRSTSRPKNAAKAERPTTTMTSSPERATSVKSTSFARAAGRPRLTLSAASRPMRIDAIIPEAPQKSAIRETKPSAESGVAMPSIDSATFVWPDSDTGRMSTSSSMTRCRSSSSCRTRPKIETRKIVSGKREKSTRYAIEAAYCVQRSRKRSSTARGRAVATPRATSPSRSTGQRTRRASLPRGSMAPVSLIA